MTKELRKWLGLPNPKPTPYTLRMLDQTITKPIGLIKDFKIHIHGIPWMVTFTVMKNNVLDSSYSMVAYAHVTHDWGNNLIAIEGNGKMQTIVVTKHLDSNIKHLEVLLLLKVENCLNTMGA
jgi:hypothetical protein